MKFAKRIEELKGKNQDRIMLAKCGVFIIAIGEDAIFLNQMFGVKLTCFKSEVCKVGIPITYILKYLEKLEEKQYSYIVYDYNRETKIIEEKYKYDGINKIEKIDNIKCSECQYYKEHHSFNNIDIFEILKGKQENKKDEN